MQLLVSFVVSVLFLSSRPKGQWYNYRKLAPQMVVLSSQKLSENGCCGAAAEGGELQDHVESVKLQVSSWYSGAIFSCFATCSLGDHTVLFPICSLSFFLSLSLYLSIYLSMSLWATLCVYLCLHNFMCTLRTREKYMYDSCLILPIYQRVCAWLWLCISSISLSLSSLSLSLYLSIYYLWVQVHAAHILVLYRTATWQNWTSILNQNLKPDICRMPKKVTAMPVTTPHCILARFTRKYSHSIQSLVAPIEINVHRSDVHWRQIDARESLFAYSIRISLSLNHCERKKLQSVNDSFCVRESTRSKNSMNQAQMRYAQI